MFNSWNENKPVKIGRDGQDIEPRCAEGLCRLFPPDPTIDLISISKKTDKHQLSRSPLSINPSEDLNHHSSHRSVNSIDRHRRHRSRSRERDSKESYRKRRHRSTSSHSEHNASRKRSHRSNENPSLSNNTDKTMSHIMANGTYEDYVKYMLETQAQYTGYTPTMFPPTNYPMVYDPTSLYPMGYDSHSMHSGGYGDPMNMYLPQTSSSISQNASEYEQEINAFLRHTTSSSHKENDNGNKSHRNNHHHHHKPSSREHRR